MKLHTPLYSSDPDNGGSGTDFERASKENSSGNIVTEMLGFLGHNKKWWLLPIIIVMLLLAVLMVAAGTGAAPFIYTLF